MCILLSLFDGIIFFISMLMILQDEYLKYFQWKKYYSIIRRFPICALCELLHKNPFKTKTYSNLQEWWYGNSKNSYCISGNDMPYTI